MPVTASELFFYRNQKVQLQFFSDWRKLERVVPQGTQLGTLLLNI